MKRGAWFPLRWVAVLVGLLFLVITPLMVLTSHASILNAIVFLAVGGTFLFYGLTGRAGRPLRDQNDEAKDA